MALFSFRSGRAAVLAILMVTLGLSLTACDAKPTMKEACAGFNRDHTKDVYVSKTAKDGQKHLRIVMIALATTGPHKGDPVYDALSNRIYNMQHALAFCPPTVKSTGHIQTCSLTDKNTGFPYRAIDYNVTCPGSLSPNGR